ncbi:MAG: hypothetical protein ACFFG0_33645 [Candidatus Thorarchaeota archaeon]
MKIFAKDRNKLTNEDIKEILQDAKLDWLKDKAAKLGIYLTEEMLKNDPARLERWLRNKAQQKGIDFDSNFESIGYQLKQLAEQMRNMGMVNTEGEVIIAQGQDNNKQIKEDVKKLIDDIADVFNMKRTQLSKFLYADNKIIKGVFESNRDLPNKLPNVILELMYNIYMTDQRESTVFDRHYDFDLFQEMKYEAIRKCQSFLERKGYNLEKIGWETGELEDSYLFFIFKTLIDELTYKKIRFMNDFCERIWSEVNYQKIEQVYLKKVMDQYYKKLTLKERAKLAFHLRNIIRMEGRLLMRNVRGAKFLMIKKPFNTWNFYITKYTNQGFFGDSLWIEIIAASSRPNPHIFKNLLNLE